MPIIRTSTTLAQNGNLEFNNATIRGDMSVDELMNIPGVKTELLLSNAGYDTYRINSLKAGGQSYIATVVFFNTCMEQVTFVPDSDVSSWDEVTEESIQHDGEILKEFMKTEFGNQDKKHSFQWGKVELSQDARNAFIYNITVRYGV